MLPFVSVALATCEKMEIADKKGQGIVMKFAKMYPPEKMGKIIDRAHEFVWWHNYPVAAFMKAVGLINKEEKEHAE